MKTEITVKEKNFRKRLDKFLEKELNIPYSAVMRMIRKGDVKVNYKKVKKNSFSLSIGDNVIAHYKSETPKKAIFPVNLHLKILYEDRDYAIISKPSGLPVQGGLNIKVSLINHLEYVFETPFLVHRLDKDTSGVIIVAKHLKASQMFMEIMKTRQIDKIYLTLLKGKLKSNSIDIELPISNKYAFTSFSVERFFGNEATLVRAKIFTGRKHQIRIHSKSMDHPIAGDKKYGDFNWNRKLSKIGLKRIFLHAFQIRFKNPITGKMIFVQDPLPIELLRFLEKI